MTAVTMNPLAICWACGHDDTECACSTGPQHPDRLPCPACDAELSVDGTEQLGTFMTFFVSCPACEIGLSFEIERR